MRSLFFLFAVVLVLSTVGNASTLESIDGNSNKEKEIRWVWKYLGSLALSCSENPECQDVKVKSVVLELNNYFPKTPALTKSPWGARLQFLSGKANPGRFDLGTEVHRLAVTDKSKNAVIYINTDLMNIDIVQWVGILAHETVHHLGYDDDEKRLPDLVGAAIAAHFQKNFIRSNLAEFSHPEIQYGFFNFPTLERPSLAMTDVGQFTLDSSYGPTAINSLCEPDEIFVSQNIGSPIWTATNIRAAQGVIAIRSSGAIKIVCKNKQNQKRNFEVSLFNRFELDFGGTIDLKTNWWEKSSKIDYGTMIGDASPLASEVFHKNVTYVVKSVKNDQTIVAPGTTWSTTITLQSLDQFQPATCVVYLTGARWAFHKSMDLPAVEKFQTCNFKQLPSGLWEVQATFNFPANTQNDLFFVPLIGLINTDGSEARFAKPSKPVIIEWKNPQAKVPMKVLSMKAVNLPEAKTFLGRGPLINSYRIEYDVPFWIEIDIAGNPVAGQEYFEFDLCAKVQGDFFIRPYSARVDRMGVFLLKTERIAIPGGTKLRYQLVLPAKIDIPMPGLRIRKVYFQADDFAWAELENRNMAEAYFLTDEIIRKP